MDRSEELLQLVLEYTNLSDETDKLHNRDSLSGYDNSELNCLDAIGRLTDAGQELFDAHRERHRGWEERELLFFRSLSEEELSGAIRFFNDYNTDLRARLGKE